MATPDSPSQHDTAALPDSGPNPSVKAPVRRPALLACVPAIALLGLAVCVPRVTTSFVPDNGSPYSSFNGHLDGQQTLVVLPRRHGLQSLLQGQVEPAVAVTGQAPIGGHVSRVWVKQGQRVAVSDPILSLTNSVVKQASAHAREAQTDAERAQVKAVGQQTALQERMASAQQRLQAAQHRVTAAAERLASARELVQRLKRGEEVPMSDIRQSSSSDAPRPAASAPEAKPVARTTARRHRRSRLARHSRHEETTPAQPDAQAAKEPDRLAEVPAARPDEKAAHPAEKAAATPEPEAKTAAPAEAKATDDDERPVGNLTAAEAVRIVRAAVAESEAAIEAAEKIKAEIGDYQQSVDTTKERLDLTGKNLEEAQQEAVDSTIQLGLSTVRAPASGVVLSVVNADSPVAAGQPIVTIGEPNQWEIRIKDFSNAWRQLQPGATLTAVLQYGPERHGAPAIGSLGEGAALGEGAVLADPAGITPGAGTRRVTVRLHSIVPPRNPGEPALIRALIVIPPGTTTSGQNPVQTGMTAVCPVDLAGARPVLSVPTSAILPAANGDMMVAVLAPAADMPLADDDLACRVVWKRVTLGVSDGEEMEIVTGLEPGERIALEPQTLYEYTQRRGPSAIVHLDLT